MYSIKEVAEIAGISIKTLRHYEKIGLLIPTRNQENNYRYYSDSNLTTLQQILFYKELEYPLKDIKEIISNSNFTLATALEDHIKVLKAKQARLDGIIKLAYNTLCALKGELKMSNKEKFQAFKEDLIAKNEQMFGEEVKAKYGQESLDKANWKIKEATEEEFKSLEELNAKVEEALLIAIKTNNPKSEEAKKAVMLHQKWLSFYWDSINKEAYLNLGLTYKDDPRFASFYDRLAEGMAAFLCAAMHAYYE